MIEYYKSKAQILFFLLGIVLCLGPLGSLHANEASQEGPSLVYVHIGPKLPAYLPVSLAQARLFNPDIKIYLVAEQAAYREYEPVIASNQVTVVAIDSLKKSQQHMEFNRRSRLDKRFREGFWHYATERFFFLEDVMTQLSLFNVVHIENDVMIYTSLKELMPVFLEKYPGIAATFDNDRRVIPGFVFVRNPKAIQSLTAYINSRIKKSENDMQLLASFKSYQGGAYIDQLPIIPPQYSQKYHLISTQGHRAANEKNYSKNYELFSSIFDAAALGQYLGGIDHFHTSKSTIGFINESCVFNPSLFAFCWKIDEEGRKVPYAVFDGELIKINNLHIHSKDLSLFYSLTTSY